MNRLSEEGGGCVFVCERERERDRERREREIEREEREIVDMSE